MTFLDELLAFSRLNAQVSGLSRAHVEEVLTRIHSDEDGHPQGWARVWQEEGRKALARKDFARATGLLCLASFPFPDAEVRRENHALCREAFSAWLGKTGAGERVELSVRGQTVPVYLRKHENPSAPLLLVIGGAVSIKEKWRTFLRFGPLLASSVVLMEMPGVGESPFVYGADSDQVVRETLDALSDHVNVDRTFALAICYGGHLFMRLSLHDSRVRSIAALGAPVGPYFDGVERWQRMPQLTTRSLAYVCRTTAEEARLRLLKVALTPEEIARMETPVTYIASLRDQLIPRADWELLATHHRALTLHCFDDEHGAPNHRSQVEKLIMIDTLRHMGRGRSPFIPVLQAGLWFDRVRARVAPSALRGEWQNARTVLPKLSGDAS